MPLFFFHLRTPSELEHDETGVECADLDAAYLEACEAIPTLSAELLDEQRDPMACSFAIADADGQIVMEVPFDELARRSRRSPACVTPVVFAVERARRLCAELREERVALRGNLARMRAVLSEGGAPSGSNRPAS